MVRICNELDKQGHLRESGHPIGGYYGIIERWINNSSFSNILDKIDDLDNYSKQNIVQKFEDIILKNEKGEEILYRKKISSDDRKREKGFLQIIADQRHINLHGQYSSQIVAPIVLNLCCLALWDEIKSEELSFAFQELKKPIPDGDPKASLFSLSQIL